MTNPAINSVVKDYPKSAQSKFNEIRTLVYNVAKENNLSDIEETLKWGQPSYLCKTGSTVRISWQDNHPNNVGIFFNCNTVLVETFKEVFGDSLIYEGNRVVMVPVEGPLPQEIARCILMALNYHKLKKLPLLGA